MTKPQERIADIIDMALQRGANIPLLINDAYVRGLRDGKDFAKRKAIEAIEMEK